MGVETTLAPYGQNKGTFPSADLHTSNKNIVYECYDDRGLMKSGMASKQWRKREPRTPSVSVLKIDPHHHLGAYESASGRGISLIRKKKNR